MASWSELQRDLLESIAQRLDKMEDFVAFGGVCTCWRAAATKNNFKGLRLWQQIPYLMLSAQDDEKDVDREFYSLIERQVVAKVSLPKLRGKKFYESLGWLLTVGSEGDMSLLNPFLGALEIQLPHQNTFPEYEQYETHPHIFVQKMALSARPNEVENFVVMLICGSVNYLAFWRPNDRNWNRIETRKSAYTDVIYHNNSSRFYAIDHAGNVVACDVSGPNPAEARVVFRFDRELFDFKEMYVFEFSSSEKLEKDSLVIVTRDNHPDFGDDQDVELEFPVYGTTEFKVYEVDLSEGGHNEVAISPPREIKSLGSRAFFLGQSASMSLEVSSNNPAIKPNHIYFTDDCWFGYISNPEGGGKDMGVYNLETRTIEPFYEGERQLLSRICPSLWVTPKF